MASTHHLHLHSPLLSGFQRPPIKSTFLLPFQIRRNPNPNPNPISITAALPSPDSFWEREEQRWLREEQRWLREESRWSKERDALLREIAALRSRLDAGTAEIVAGGGPEVAPPRQLLAESADVKEMVIEEVGVFKEEVGAMEMEKKERRALRKGSEGEDVKEMQEALHKLGFYSGEEDMEYSNFSSGTERAVKTWQASLGTPEDGIMTTQLLKKLFMEEEIGDSGRDVVNGTTVASITESGQRVVKESGDAEDDESHHKVFLLGENRWEEPSRLKGRNNPISGSKGLSSRRCLTCRGEGRLMCTECDGSGEPNIEPQFLEWVGEETKCPYCEGLGHTSCDVCEGTGMA